MTWSCDAYGPEGAAVGAVCFLTAGVGGHKCPTLETCTALMRAERQRVFSRINELAAAGDDVFQELAEEFPTPDTVFGG